MRGSQYWVYTLLLWLLASAAVAQEPQAGKLLVESGHEALHLGAEVDVRIQGLQAEVLVSQRFQNTSPEWINATYVYPLAEDSAVHHLTMRVGERVIEGEIKEKAEARKIYQQAKAQGKKATLLEQQRPNLFRQQIANIGPGETIEVEIGYSQQVIYDMGEFRLRLPMTLTPRYIPGVSRRELLPQKVLAAEGSGWSLATDQVLDAPMITPPQQTVQPGRLLNPVAINVQLNAGVDLARVSSASHALKVSRPNGSAAGVRQVQFAHGQVSMDRDFELSWLPVAQQAPVAAQFVDQWQGDRYAQIMLMPPQKMSAEQVLPRELLLIIDTSGSMAGQSIEQARASALQALDQLTPGDRFNVILFAGETRTLFPHAVAAQPNNVNRAADAIRAMRAEGGTEMHDALARAFEHEPLASHLQQVVFVTDGSVGNESALLKLIHRHLGDARLFTVAIGSAPNRYFMRRAAEYGRGTFTEITSTEQVQARMAQLLEKLRKPVVTNISIDWPQPVEAFPRKVPDLYWGEPLLVTVKMSPWPGRSDQRIIIRGDSAGSPWQRELRLPEPGNESDASKTPVLAQRFGREKIAFLEDEAIRQAEDARVKVLPVALRYQLMSRFTSLVAVDKTPSKPEVLTAKERSVANAMPVGSQMQAVGYPQTATNLYWHWLIGAFAALGLWRIQRPGVNCES
ncbi:marine proteobacterial sortase target protein [Gilvimarinus agarilyticus]|uniref:marine proteobacterial sortase target protein n=1 Tax=Gilvimarinus sp. 2_MG-2023 TaxID=3062666 RepID=UPI001C09D7F4|nr:marine proteobacterial sortase target protein [Gilvimarinus sp. 2_MG-2023]MBU2885299.1 marine proteobacterial sortase target protein [Gilvimarinus agarilyticus]MDO6570198.1 marine proteobacterial sortase target protein [Gilvimarinus sp. 2_MG-2023]